MKECCQRTIALKELNETDGYINEEKVYTTNPKWKELNECLFCGEKLNANLPQE